LLSPSATSSSRLFRLGGSVGVLDQLLASDCINHEQSNPELRGMETCTQWANDVRLEELY
jgi:hypothetical protein